MSELEDRLAELEAENVRLQAERNEALHQIQWIGGQFRSWAKRAEADNAQLKDAVNGYLAVLASVLVSDGSSPAERREALSYLADSMGWPLSDDQITMNDRDFANLTTENERMKKVLGRIRFCFGPVDDDALVGFVERLQTENARLRTAVDLYGEMNASCLTHGNYCVKMLKTHPDTKCSCGLDDFQAALAQVGLSEATDG